MMSKNNFAGWSGVIRPVKGDEVLWGGGERFSGQCSGGCNAAAVTGPMEAGNRAGKRGEAVSSAISFATTRIPAGKSLNDVRSSSVNPVNAVAHHLPGNRMLSGIKLNSLNV